MKKNTNSLELREERAALERSILLQQAAQSLAHEIRNPLGSLRGRLQLIGRKIEDPKASAGIRDAIDIIDEIVTSSLDQFGFKSDVNLLPVNLDITALIVALAERYSHRFQKRKVTFHIEDPNKVISFEGDRQMILLALECLLEGFLLQIKPDHGGEIKWSCDYVDCETPDHCWIEFQGPSFLPINKYNEWRTFDPLFFENSYAQAWPFSVAHFLLAKHGGIMRIRALSNGDVGLKTYLPCSLIDMDKLMHQRNV